DTENAKEAAQERQQCFLTGCSSDTASTVGQSEFTIGNKDFVIIGDTEASRARIQSELGDIFSTTRGGEMLANLEDRRSFWFFKKDFVVDLTVTNNAYAYPGGDAIYVDPNFHPEIQTTDGPMAATTRRIMAHELGHAVFSTPDDGLYRMNNIIRNENLIMNALGQPSRTEY
ncbi:M91 family zinc metallopeptidase, partial [Microbulbifer sp. 2205BS26-8]|uniref:M91 family zinc metallopeptidase n=1 Tax=Microbulbifer sp. 2205BS26-8 TaxID=3064386 RepID=UPI00273EEA42